MLEEVRALIQDNCDEEQSQKMAAYMKDHFRFAGIPKPQRKNCLRLC
ncbi:MAG: DNA alkylation repair protein [Acutalibacteraceae bacterium]